jgi:hypothetical protein
MTALVLLALSGPADAAVSGWVRASSTLIDSDNQRHPAEKAVDGLLSSGWGEGADGYGEGAWLDVDLGQLTEVNHVSIWPGNLSEGKKSYREYSRPRTLKITLQGGSEEVVKEVVLEDRVQRLDVAIEGGARKVRIDVVDAYEGFVFSDLFIAEVAVNFYRDPDRTAVIDAWLKSPDALARAEAHEEKIRENYNRINDADFGDSEALEFIMSQAADGADYVRQMVPQVVDVGYRAEAIPPDPVAIKALRKLKDPNAIPAIEMAALRSVGDVARDLTELSEIFYAHQELIGGPGFGAPAWGDEGWGPGNLRSFGEPLPIEVDEARRVYVADVGNNRVQRYKESGTYDRQWGPEADITNEWMGVGRPWYASGAAAGSEPGRFRNALDVELLPDKKAGDSMAVLDAYGAVQIFDPQGRRVGGWSVEIPGFPDDGVGGQAYLAWVAKKKKLVVVFRDRLFAYSLEGELLAEAELADGVPGAVEVGKNSKLYMAYDQYVVMYEWSGFKHGVIMGPEVLGEGYESMDITLDEKKKMWIVTDQGTVFKFKRPGKVDFTIQASEISLVYPRLAAREDLVWITDRDRIIALDAAQKRLDEEAAAEEAALEQ